MYCITINIVWKAENHEAETCMILIPYNIYTGLTKNKCKPEKFPLSNGYMTRGANDF